MSGLDDRSDLKDWGKDSADGRHCPLCGEYCPHCGRRLSPAPWYQPLPVQYIPYYPAYPYYPTYPNYPTLPDVWC
jgi:hypothetical protein